MIERPGGVRTSGVNEDGNGILNLSAMYFVRTKMMQHAINALLGSLPRLEVDLLLGYCNNWYLQKGFVGLHLEIR